MTALSTLLGVTPLMQAQTNALVATIKGQLKAASPGSTNEDLRRITAHNIFSSIVESFDLVFPDSKRVSHFGLGDDLNLLSIVMHAYSCSAAGLEDSDLQLAIAAHAANMVEIGLSTKRLVDKMMDEPHDKTRQQARKDVMDLFWSSVNNNSKE